MKIPKNIAYIASALALQLNIASAQLDQSTQKIIDSSISDCGTILDTQFSQTIDRERFCQNVFVKLEQDYNSLTPQEKGDSKILSQILNSNLSIYLSELIGKYPDFYLYIQQKYQQGETIDFRTMFIDEFGIFASPDHVFMIGENINITGDNLKLFKDFDYSHIDFYKFGKKLWNNGLGATVHNDSIFIDNPNNLNLIANELGHVYLMNQYELGPVDAPSGTQLNISDLELHEFISDVFDLYQDKNSLSRIINLVFQSLAGSDQQKRDFNYDYVSVSKGYRYTLEFMTSLLHQIYRNKDTTFFDRVHYLAGKGYNNNDDFTQGILQELTDEDINFILDAYFKHGEYIISELDKISGR